MVRINRNPDDIGFKGDVAGPEKGKGKGQGVRIINRC
jgi:hypothetical protein